MTDRPYNVLFSCTGNSARALAEGNAAEVALAFADSDRMLANRISLMIDLPMASLDRLSLQRRLDEIGQPAGEPAKA